MKKILMLLMGLSIVAFGKEPAKIKVGITQIMEHQALDSAREGFIKALKDGGYGEAKIDYQNAQGDFGTAHQVLRQLIMQLKKFLFL